MGDYSTEFEKWKSPTTTTTTTKTKSFLGLRYFVTRSQKYTKYQRNLLDKILFLFTLSSWNTECIYLPLQISYKKKLFEIYSSVLNIPSFKVQKTSSFFVQRNNSIKCAHCSIWLSHKKEKKIERFINRWRTRRPIIEFPVQLPIFSFVLNWNGCRHLWTIFNKV